MQSRRVGFWCGWIPRFKYYCQGFSPLYYMQSVSKWLSMKSFMSATYAHLSAGLLPSATHSSGQSRSFLFVLSEKSQKGLILVHPWTYVHL